MSEEMCMVEEPLIRTKCEVKDGQPVDLKDVYESELDFNRWLYHKFIHKLEDCLGFKLIPRKIEFTFEGFRVDMLLEDEDGNVIVVECQFGRSDHDHYGKLKTYFCSHNAKFGVWVLEKVHPLHVVTVSSDNDLLLPYNRGLYIVTVNCIGTYEDGKLKDATPLFSIHTGPTIEQKAVGTEKRIDTDEKNRAQVFIDQLLEKSQQAFPNFQHETLVRNALKMYVDRQNLPGVCFQYRILQNSCSVWFGLWLTSASTGGDINKSRYDFIRENSEDIINRFGQERTIEWLGDRSSLTLERSAKYAHNSGGYINEEKWSETQDEIIEVMKNFTAAFEVYIPQLYQIS